MCRSLLDVEGSLSTKEESRKDVLTVRQTSRGNQVLKVLDAQNNITIDCCWNNNGEKFWSMTWNCSESGRDLSRCGQSLVTDEQKWNRLCNQVSRNTFHYRNGHMGLIYYCTCRKVINTDFLNANMLMQSITHLHFGTFSPSSFLSFKCVLPIYFGPFHHFIDQQQEKYIYNMSLV